MVSRLLRGGHECVVYDRESTAVERLAGLGATGTASLDDFVGALSPPRAVWLMLPAAIVDRVIEELEMRLQPGDIVIDGGNSYYIDDIRRASALLAKGLHYVDVGTSGGVWGEARGFCLMIGGERTVVESLQPLFSTLAPGRGAIPRTRGRSHAHSTAEDGYLHCGVSGAGHFVKMIHNAIEYGLMAAYAEGLNILRKADVGKIDRAADAETTPLRHPEHYRYDFDVAEITELWRRGSVVSSWLLDLTATALLAEPGLEKLSGTVADSGETRWALAAAIDQGVPVPVLSAALYERFASRGADDFANRVLSAMRFAFGGHIESQGND